MIAPCKCIRGWLCAGWLVVACVAAAGAEGASAGSLAQMFKSGAAAYAKGDYGSTIALFSQIVKEAAPGPALDPVYYTLASARLRKGDNDGAIGAFRLYLKLYPNGAQINDARAGLTRALIVAGRIPESLAAINGLRDLGRRRGAQGIDNYPSVLGLVLDISDSLLAAGKPAEALPLLQSAPHRDEVILRQRARIAQLTRLGQLSLVGGGPPDAGTSIGANRDALASRLKDAQAALKSVEDNADFDIPALLREGQCYLMLQRPWEATVVYREILARYPASPDKVYALRGLIFAREGARRYDDTVALCQQFLRQFPSSQFAAEVAAIGGEVAAQLDENKQAETFFGQALGGSKGQALERVVFQLGAVRFALREWAGAREMFDRYVKDYPRGEWADNAAYRSALSWFLDMKDAERYAKAEKAIKAFVAAHPGSAYLTDACYRLAVCQFAFQEYKPAIAACDAWEKRFPANALLGEVLSLKGDVQKTLGENDGAIDTYLRAASAATSDDVLSYTLGEAGRLLEQKRDWDRIVSVFSAQIAAQPDSRLIMGWYYWVARAKARSGHMDEAWSYLADRLGMQIDNPANEDVEKMIALMAQIRVRLRPAAAAQGTGSTPPPTALEELSARLKLDEKPSVLVQARLRYYQAKVDAFSRKPAEAEKIMLSIGHELKPDRMSAALLGTVGQALCKNGEADKASGYFNTLLEKFPASDYRDYAYTGLGDIALDQKKPADALKLFDAAINKAGAVHLLREATVGQARCQLALGDYDKATRLFQTIAGAKEWRGEATALSLYYLGVIAVKQGDLPKGIAFFQRVFVSQVRYTRWVVKSYLASGEAFETLGKIPDAVATYREMLRNDRLRDTPEFAAAQARLQALAPNP